MSTTPRKKILFLTNSQYGEAQVVIAVSHELLRRGNCDVHIASYSALSGRVKELDDGAFGAFPRESSSVTLHEFSGLSMHETRTKKFGINDIHHKPGVRGALGMFNQLAMLIGTWTGEDWVRTCHECQDIIKSVEPDIVVVDSYFFIGIDAVRHLEVEYMVLSPNTFMEVRSDQQSLLGSFVKYPAKGSGFSFPLRRRQIPSNIYLNIRQIYRFVTASAIKDIQKSRKQDGRKGPFPAFKSYDKKITYMLPSTPESDFLIAIPDNFVCCGPIFVPGSLDRDPELKRWLEGRPTVLLNLGSFLKAEGKHVQELAKGVEILLNHNKEIQVLWKLKCDNELPSEVKKILQEHLDSGRVRIEKWLKVEPSAIVTSGHVVCSVNHGGANSYFEAVSAGIPQIILPAWYDTYEFAVRVEYLGIGIYGSKKSKSAPEADGAELSSALIAVTEDSEQSRAMKAKAKKLAEVCNKYGGRAKAADKILEKCISKGNEKQP